MTIDTANITDISIRAALHEVFAEAGISEGQDGRTLYLKKTVSGPEVSMRPDSILIGYSRICEIMRGISIVKEHFNEDGFCCKEKSSFRTLALMADNSRNAVNNVETTKKAIRILSLMGYSMYMIYLEDIYEVPEYKYFGYMRGRYSRDEIRQIDDYADMLGIELVPAIQTLAHLNTLFRWPEFAPLRDIDDILLAGAEETYRLIGCMIGSVGKSFRSRRINIGMDEAFALGKGRYAQINGIRSQKDIMTEHLQRVLDICVRNELHPMMWSDMFTRNPEGSAGTLPDDIRENVGLIHWDYVTSSTEAAAEMLEKHQKMVKNVIFAGGAWKWEGYAPFISYSFQTSMKALEAVKRCGIDEVILTAWSDSGGEASLFSVLPVFQLYAETCYNGRNDMEHLSSRLSACADAYLDDFISLEIANLPVEGETGGGFEMNPLRYLIFQDILCGLYDRHVIVDQFSDHYAKLVKLYHFAALRNPKWSYIFETMMTIADLLNYKCDIGIRLKKAYDDRNHAALESILGELGTIRDKCSCFHQAVRKQWLTENKGFGLDVQDIRIGGLSARTDTAALRIRDLLEGRINRIDELEEERLYADGRPEDQSGSVNTHVWFWRDVVTAGVLDR